MFRRPSFFARRFASTLTRVASRQGVLECYWSDGAAGRFHHAWLRDHCPQSRHPVSGQRTFEDLVAWVEKQAKLPGTPAAPVSVTSSRKAGGASASARGAKASSSRAGFASSEQLRASAFSLLTEHDPLTVGVYLFGGALCSAAALMVFICVASGSRAAREAAVA